MNAIELNEIVLSIEILKFVKIVRDNVMGQTIDHRQKTIWLIHVLISRSDRV